MRKNEFSAKYVNGGFAQVRRVVMARGADPDLAQDLAQDAWLLAWQHLGELRNQQRLISWVISIAVNLLSSKRRARGPRYCVLDHYPTCSDETKTAEIDVARLSKLCSIRQQLILTLYRQGMSGKEIARELAVSDQIVQKDLSRARRLMRSYVQGAA